MSFSLADSHSYPGKNYTHKTLFPVAHQEHSSTEQHSTMALRYSRYRLTAWFVPDPCEAFTRSVGDLDFARQGSRARALLYSSLLLFSLPCESSYWEAIPIRKINATKNWFIQKERHVYHGLADSTLRLRHKKTTAAVALVAATTLTLYLYFCPRNLSTRERGPHLVPGLKAAPTPSQNWRRKWWRKSSRGMVAEYVRIHGSSYDHPNKPLCRTPLFFWNLNSRNQRLASTSSTFDFRPFDVRFMSIYIYI